MTGLPQVIESGWLYPPGAYAPAAVVRLERRPDGTCELLLNDPAGAPTQRREFPDETAARVELDRLYAEGAADGEWRVYRSTAGAGPGA